VGKTRPWARKATGLNVQQRQEKEASTMSIPNPFAAVATGIRVVAWISLGVVSFGLEKAFHIGEPTHAELAPGDLNVYELADPMLDGTSLSSLACIVVSVGMKECNM
jgi:hypothetical protein